MIKINRKISVEIIEILYDQLEEYNGKVVDLQLPLSSKHSVSYIFEAMLPSITFTSNNDDV